MKKALSVIFASALALAASAQQNNSFPVQATVENGVIEVPEDGSRRRRGRPGEIGDQLGTGPGGVVDRPRDGDGRTFVAIGPDYL